MTSLRASVTPELLLAANRASTLEAVFRWMVHDLPSPARTLAFIPAMWEDRPSEEDRRWLDALAVACDRLTGNIARIDRLLGGTADAGRPSRWPSTTCWGS
ncbi:MAG: hypothetical protein H0T86_14740 [Gemmatimonadales bacterium]|nr:hypothetical protein [Gemmatimonadales bacterium]